MNRTAEQYNELSISLHTEISNLLKKHLKTGVWWIAMGLIGRFGNAKLNYGTAFEQEYQSEHAQGIQLMLKAQSRAKKRAYHDGEVVRVERERIIALLRSSTKETRGIGITLLMGRIHWTAELNNIVEDFITLIREETDDSA